MTTREMKSSYYRIMNGFYEVVDKGSAADMLNWVMYAYDNLNDILNEARQLETLTADERKVLAQAQDELASGYHATRKLQERYLDD